MKIRYISRSTERQISFCGGNDMATFDDFMKFDIRVGTIVEVRNLQ